MRKPILLSYLDLLLVFTGCIFIFTYIITYVNADIQAHLNFVKNLNEGLVSYPPNFLFYFLVNLFSGFSSNNFLLYSVSVVLLSLASTAKYLVSKRIIIGLNEQKKIQSRSLKFIGVVFGLFMCFAIPDPLSLVFLKKMYLGKIVPMVWHNSTTILVFPFALLLFWQQIKIFSESKKIQAKSIIFITVLLVLNIIIKPSFIFCYLPITFLFILIRIKDNGVKWFMFNCIPLVIGGLFILIEYYLIYKLNVGSFKTEASGIMLSWPFQVYTFWIPWWLIPLSFLLSFALPVGTVILYREILKYKPFIYATALMGMGLLISALVLESGPRMAHGNFTWQNVVCSFILFLVVLSYLTPKFLDQANWSRKKTILMGLFGLHILSGFLYIFKIVLTNQYI